MGRSSPCPGQGCSGTLQNSALVEQISLGIAEPVLQGCYGAMFVCCHKLLFTRELAMVCGPCGCCLQVQHQASHRRTVLLPMLLCASFLSAHSRVPHLLKNQSFLAFSHFHKLFSTLKKMSQFTHHCFNSICKLWMLIRGGLARPRKDSWWNERWFPAEMPVCAGWD